MIERAPARPAAVQFLAQKRFAATRPKTELIPTMVFLYVGLVRRNERLFGSLIDIVDES